MGAIAYVHVLKKAYNSTAEPEPGFNTIMYDEMEDAYSNMHGQIIYHQHTEEFKRNFIAVRASVLRALETLTKNAYLTKTDRDLVERYVQEMNSEFFDKERLDNILIIVGEMLSKYNGD